MTVRAEKTVTEEATEKKRVEFVSQKEAIIEELIAQGKYSCCLENPCTSCIEESPDHGEGATCSCLEDVVGRRHPCAGCMGGILKGQGNPYLAEYFASALADEIGEQHLDTLKQIISEKYTILIKEQL